MVVDNMVAWELSRVGQIKKFSPRGTMDGNSTHTAPVVREFIPDQVMSDESMMGLMSSPEIDKRSVKKEKKEKKDKKDKKDKKHKKDKKDKKSKKEKKAKKEKKVKRERSSPSPKKRVVVRTGVKRPAAAGQPAAEKRRRVIKLTEDDFEPVNRWWEKSAPADDDEFVPKWTTLEHRGLMFTPDYEPHGVPLLYKNVEVKLDPAAEEVATFFAQTLGTDWCTKDKFIDNFWNDFKSLLPKKSPVKTFKDCNFSLIKEFMDTRSAERKARSKEEKDKETVWRKEVENPYTHALVDSLRERIGNFRTEPPNLFRGRGEHPKMGMLKKRIVPEDVTLNTGMDAPVPRVDHPAGHAWKDVVHDNCVTWLAWYHDSINGMFKYMFLNAASGFKGQSDWEKYEKARRLKKFIGKIRSDYEKKMKSTDENLKQIGTVAYLIDRLALRVGNEKNVEEEADTVGCCSLRVEHMKFEPENQITLDFLGKDSIRYFNTVTVDPRVYTNLKAFIGRKKSDAMIFDIDPDDINKYFKSFMPDLSAKVFRTYNASITLEGELYRLAAAKAEGIKQEDGDTSMDVNIDELTKLYNEANRRVAILCNHQRAPPKTHEAGMTTLRKKYEDVQRFITSLKTLKSGGTRALSPDDRSFLEETCKFNLNAAETQITRKIHALMVQAEKLERTMEDKEDNKTVSLTTSKINYMDPRISVAFCKRVDLPIERVFSKTIRNKFPWAMHSKSDWLF
jgi:DNA topoisomerase I